MGLNVQKIRALKEVKEFWKVFGKLLAEKQKDLLHPCTNIYKKIYIFCNLDTTLAGGGPEADLKELIKNVTSSEFVKPARQEVILKIKNKIICVKVTNV